jgi:hypothetical protein
MARPLRRKLNDYGHPQAELVRLDTGVSSLVSHRLANPVDDPSRQNSAFLAAGIIYVTL